MNVCVSLPVILLRLYQRQIPPLLLILQCKLSEFIFFEVDFYISRVFSLIILSGFAELQTTVHLAQMPQLQSMVFVSTFLLKIQLINSTEVFIQDATMYSHKIVTEHEMVNYHLDL